MEIQERLVALQKMWKEVPKHKASEKLQSDIKQKISATKEEVEQEKKSGKKGGVKLAVLPSPYRELTGPLLRYIHRLDRKRDDDIITVIIPEFVPAKWWQHLLHNQRALLIKGALLFRPNVVVTSVPFHLER